MNNTPETDAAWDEYISPPYTYGAGDLRILAERLERERDEARNEIDNIRKMLSKSGEAIGNGDHDYSIIEMIQNIIRSKSYFIRKSYAEFFKPVIDEEGAK
jgi:hypothetical protein